MSERTQHYAAGPGGADGTCRFCGTKLAPEQIGTGVCGAQECHNRMIEESGRAILARKRAKHDEVSGEVFAAVANDLDAARESAEPDALTWMLPAQNDPLEPLPPERLEKFKEHLAFCVTYAFREPEPAPDADLGSREAHEPNETPLSDAACATCQGRCCRDRGGDTALLLPSDVARYRQRHPGVTEDEVMQAYLSHLPDLSTRDGCVYQAITGCTLPRAMRQDICNSYYCDALRWLRTAAQEAQTGAAVLVAAHEGTAQRIATVAADGTRTPVADFTREPT